MIRCRATIPHNHVLLNGIATEAKLLIASQWKGEVLSHRVRNVIVFTVPNEWYQGLAEKWFTEERGCRFEEITEPIPSSGHQVESPQFVKCPGCKIEMAAQIVVLAESVQIARDLKYCPICSTPLFTRPSRPVHNGHDMVAGPHTIISG